MVIQHTSMDPHESMLNRFVLYQCLRVTESLCNEVVWDIMINSSTINGGIFDQFTIQVKLIGFKWDSNQASWIKQDNLEDIFVLDYKVIEFHS